MGSLPLAHASGTAEHLLATAPLTMSDGTAALTNTSAFLQGDSVDTNLVTHGMFVSRSGRPARWHTPCSEDVMTRRYCAGVTTSVFGVPSAAMSENIYDDREFFAAYEQLGRSVHGLAGAPEWSSVRSLLPDLVGAHVVDLGSGFGAFARWAAGAGATDVLALDCPRAWSSELRRSRTTRR